MTFSQIFGLLDHFVLIREQNKCCEAIFHLAWVLLLVKQVIFNPAPKWTSVKLADSTQSQSCKFSLDNKKTMQIRTSSFSELITCSKLNWRCEGVRPQRLKPMQATATQPQTLPSNKCRCHACVFRSVSLWQEHSKLRDYFSFELFLTACQTYRNATVFNFEIGY